MNASELIRFWDKAILGFLDGSSAVPDAVKPWFDCYRGRGVGAVATKAFPEPYLGDLKAKDIHAVFLALNPGRAHLDFQGRRGVFAREILREGSYHRWAAKWPYLGDPWVRRKGPNRHHRSRLRFMRRWFNDPQMTAQHMATFELFPWHSTRVTALMRPDACIVKDYIWEPIACLGNPVIFAFGAPWFRLLEPLGVRILQRLGAGGARYPTTAAGRSVSVGRTPEGLTVIAEKHSGSVGPPSATETDILRTALKL
jgi:hypothetical protein